MARVTFYLKLNSKIGGKVWVLESTRSLGQYRPDSFCDSITAAVGVKNTATETRVAGILSLTEKNKHLNQNTA